MLVNVDTALLNELVDVIYKRIEEKFSKQLNDANVEFTYDGIILSTVSDSDGNTTHANVELPFCTLTELPNLCGCNLTVGDKVKIFYKKSNMSNAYIGAKF